MTAAAGHRVHPVTGLLLVAERDLLRHLRDRGRLVSDVAQVGFLLLVFGVAFQGMVGEIAGVPMRVFVFPGIACMNVVLTAFGNGVSLAWDRRYGFVRELLVAPYPRWVLPVAKTLSAAVVALLHVVALLPIALGMGVPLSGARVLSTLAAASVLCVAFAALGVLLSVLLSKPEAVQVVMGVLMTPLFLLSGAVFAADRLPAWLASVVYANPMTYAVDLLRTAMLGPGVSTAAPWWASALVLGVLATGGVLLAARRPLV